MGCFRVQSHSNTQKYSMPKMNDDNGHYKKTHMGLEVVCRNNTVINSTN